MPILTWIYRCMMGSGSSLSSRSSTPERNVPEINRNNSVLHESWNGHVIANDVAPIMISRDCCEEFQIKIERQKPVIGSISEGNLKHPLIQGIYFLVADHYKGVDEVNTLSKYGVPNFHSVSHAFPVYGMGQPSGSGLHQIIDILLNDNQKNVIFMNLRDEPLLFLSHDGDQKPYSPRCKVDLLHNITSRGNPKQIEASIAKEVIQIATTNEDNQFYFYDNVSNLKEDPQKYHVKFLDNFQTAEEVYTQHLLTRPKTKYIRLPFRNTPSDDVVDSFLSLVKEIPGFFDQDSTELPAFVANCQTGRGRTTVMMVMCCLLLAHKRGYQEQINSTKLLNNKEMEAQGSFLSVLKLVELFPNGFQIQKEVDIMINVCGKLVNIREEMNENKMKMDNLQQDNSINGISARSYFMERTLKYLERYCFLMIFNSYLHDQFSQMFLSSFQSWMRQRPELVRLLCQNNCAQKNKAVEILTQTGQVLVSDESFECDVLGSKLNAGVSNFRGVPGMPTYGMAQPTYKGLEQLVPYLTENKQRHPVVHLLNLRSDLVVECDGETYTIKHTSDLATNIYFVEMNMNDLEEKEAQLKTEILRANYSVQVYKDINCPSLAVKFQNIMTMREMYESKGSASDKLIYHHLPISCHENSPKEQDFDRIMFVIRDLEEFYSDEDGPALLFSCHNGKTWTTIGMVIAGLLCWHKRGLPVGTKIGQQERVCLTNAEYTKGEFAVVMQIVRRLPKGLQVKREIDLMLDKCSETMTPMHYHLREIIFSTCNKVKISSAENKQHLLMLSLAYLERYIYLILFNCYLHMERATGWKKTFAAWMKETGYQVGAYTILDTLNFHDVEGLEDTDIYSCRERWKFSAKISP